MQAIACVAMLLIQGCSAELAQRPPSEDPTSAAAAEAPYHRPPAYEPDPLLSPIPKKSADHGEHPKDGAP
jgi:hypothetical protein